MIDSAIYKRFNLKGIKGVLTIISAYLLLGVVSGVIVMANKGNSKSESGSPRRYPCLSLPLVL